MWSPLAINSGNHAFQAAMILLSTCRLFDGDRQRVDEKMMAGFDINVGQRIECSMYLKLNGAVMVQELPPAGDFSHGTLVEFDETPLKLAEVRRENIVFNGELVPLCWRAVDVGPLGEVARSRHQSIRSDLDEVFVVTLSSGFKTPATQAGAGSHLDELGTIGLPQLSDKGWVVPRISAGFQLGRAGCWHS